MNSYLFIKTVHISCAIITFLGFSLRGYWMLVASKHLQHKLVRILPHLVDTLLLLSAIALVVMSRQYPFSVDWVTMKVVLLIVYIVLGTFALKRGKTRRLQALCFSLALLTIAAIFSVALLKPVF